MRWTLCRKRASERNRPMVKTEKEAVEKFLRQARSSKFSVEPDLPGRVVFIAEDKLVGQAELDGYLPRGFIIQAASIDYMPMAFDGMEDKFEEGLRWFEQLPDEYRQL